MASLLILKHLLSNPLKPSEHFNQLTAVFLCNRIYQVGGYNGLNDLSIGRNPACCLLLAEYVLTQEGTGHVACQRDVVPGSAVLYIYAQTVCIRISCPVSYTHLDVYKRQGMCGRSPWPGEGCTGYRP